MLMAAETDAKRANLLNKIIKMLCDLSILPFSTDIVISVQSTIVSYIEKIEDSASKQLLRPNVESLIARLPDSESKMLFTKILNEI